MIKDRGPIFQLGSGATSRDLPYDEAEVEGVNPESGAISKALHHHPVMRFFATAATTMAGMAVAGSLVRGGGVRLGLKLQESGKPWVTNAIKDIRKIQQQMDQWAGVKRIFAEGDDVTYATSSKLFVRDPNSRKIMTDRIEDRTGFFFTQAEKEAGRSGIEGPVEWTYKDQIQKNLIKSARRLPYELPTAYFVQRGLTDKLFGTNDEFEGNWYNPADVFTDFVTQSVKTTAAMIAPFEVGGASLSHTWRKVMSYGDDFTNMRPAQRTLAEGSVVLRDVLGRLGQDAGELLNKGIKFSAQTSGAMSAGLNEARTNSYTLMRYLHETRHGTKQAGVKDNNKIYQRVMNKLGEKIDPHILDTAPGPFKGGYTGFKAAKEKFQEIGRGYEAFDKLMELGRSGYDDYLAAERASGNIGRKNAADMLDSALRNNLSNSGTPIEDLATQINILGRGGHKSPAFRHSKFYEGQAQNEYTKIVHSRLIKAGMSEKSAKEFSKMVNINRPSGSGAERSHLTNRVKFGDGKIYSDTTSELYDEIYRKVGTSLPAADHAILKRTFKDVIETSDSMFTNEAFQRTINRRIAASWTMAEDRVLPHLGDRLLKKTKPEYREFLGKLDKDHSDYLKRRTAQRTGLNLTDSRGNVVGDAIIDDHLRKMKFDPVNDLHTMRAYLTTKGDISKPWQKDGFNVFGLKPLTVADASDKGYFRSSEHNEAQVNRLINRMGNNDPVPLSDYTLGGVYQTASGRVVDFNIAKQGIRKFTNKLSSETQIPLIHVSPLELLGYSAKQDMAERSILQYAPGMSDQAFLGRAYGKDDFYLWTKKSGRGSKGKVFAFGVNESGLMRADELDGFYRPFAAKAGNIASRHAKIASGNLGRAPASPKDIDKNSWFYKKLGPEKYTRLRDTATRARQVLSINDDQPDSIFRMVGRFRNRKTDINNPTVMARLLRDGEIDTPGGVHRLVDGSVVDESGKVVASAKEFSEAFDGFSNRLRRRGLSKRATVGLTEQEGLEDIFTEDFRGTNAKTFDASAGPIDISKLETPAQFLEAASIRARLDEELIDSLPEEAAQALRRANKTLLWNNISKSGSSDYWGRALPGAKGSTSIHTRLDEFKLDYMKYLMIKKGLTGKGQGEFATLIGDVNENLLKLRRTGRITQSELTEARTALLSTQINFQSFIGYSRTTPSLSNARRVSQAVGESKMAKEALSDIAEGRMGNAGSRFDPFMPFVRRNLGVSDYEYEGGSYNPFGDTNTVFVPTFGTAYARNPVQAVKSVLGVNTWDNQLGFSGLSIPGSHFVERLNKYAGTFGLSLDPTDFKGPMDMFARGMVMKRALPIMAASTAVLTADRTIGGFMQPKDENDERVYSPFFIGLAAKGVVEAQAATALIPGGQTYGDRREELLEGEVPIRAGRWWPLGNTPFEGGRIQYFRPSWYRRLTEAHLYTDQTYGSPLERMSFGYDYSPLRPLDPYRFERQHYYDRPYPESGDYFTGPWGPLNPILNSTIGRVLKPRKKMHEAELEVGLSTYQSLGDQGAYMPAPTIANQSSGGFPGGGGGGYGGIAAAQNQTYAAAGRGRELGTVSSILSEDIGGTNAMYSTAASYGPPSRNYGVGEESNVMRPTIISADRPISSSSFEYHLGELGFRTQELFGIYGFAFASGRSALGFGNKDMAPEAPVLANAAAAYGSTRGFWDLNIGGLGDLPLPIEGNYANLELSEIVRRFVPKERAGMQVINPIPNLMGIEHSWLPGSDYYINFKQGDPYTAVQEGEMRLPGVGYERFNRLHSDETGRYGLVDKHKILGDVAPWSTEYRQIDSLVRGLDLDPRAQEVVDTTREQVQAKSLKHEFTPYEYKYSSASDLLQSPLRFGAGKAKEWFAHRDTYFNTKFLPDRTAVEDWERENVYGATFPEWESPIENFLKPIVHKATQRHPVAATLTTGLVGSLFGRTPAMKTVGSLVGGTIGLGSSMFGRTYEMVTGDRYMPVGRKKEIALEEYADILDYTKNMRLYKQAEAAGDAENASRFRQQAQQTMYGADIYNADMNQLAMAVPKRKREHFRAMIAAPEEERDQILSTAGRLERRLYQAAWGRKVEERPDLESYFQKHELPPPDWEGWHPNTNMDDVKIKIAQNMGIELSELGYYPQEIREANLINMSYPSYSGGSDAQGYSTVAQLRQLMSMQGINGDVIPIATPYAGNNVQLSAGLFSGV